MNNDYHQIRIKQLRTLTADLDAAVEVERAKRGLLQYSRSDWVNEAIREKLEKMRQRETEV